MDEALFLKNFGDLFDDTDVSGFTLQTKFRDLDEWCSVLALGVMAMCAEEYDVIISANEMESAEKIEDIFNLVKERYE